VANKYCIFDKDTYDGEQLIWEKNKRYIVVFEDEKNYYFGKIVNDIDYGVDKKSENKSYIVINILHNNQ
jgi:hypothetical protein